MNDSYHYTESGLDNVWLRGGVEYRVSPYGKTVSIQDVRGLHEAIARLLCGKSERLTGKECRFLRVELDLSRKKLAELIVMSHQAIENWELGGVVRNGAVDKIIRQLYLESVGDDPRFGELIKHLAEHDRQDLALVLSKKNNVWSNDQVA